MRIVEGYLKKVLGPVSAVTLLAMLVAGCSDGSTPSTTSSPTTSTSPQLQPSATKKPPTEISMMNVYYSGDAPNMSNNEFIQVIEEHTNTKLDITWVPAAAYNDKFNVTLASGQLPKVLLSLSNSSKVLLDAYRSGEFWEIGPYIDQFPNLKKMNKGVFENISIDGKIYGLYRARDLVRMGIMYRKDWADKLGLKEPQTMEDLNAMIKAFTLNDPDGNGKDDTYGLAEDKTLSGFKQLITYMGGPNTYGMKDGKFVPSHMTSEHLDAMKFYRTVIQQKMINPDFLLLTDPQKREQVTTGKAGMLFGSMNIVTLLQEAGEKLNPNFKMDVLSTVNGPKGKFTLADSGYNGVFLFPKSSVKSEAELKGLLDFFDKLGDQKMQNLLEYGIEGKDYTQENGKVVKSATARTDFPKYLPQLRVDSGDLITPQKSASALELKWKELTRASEKMAVRNQGSGIIVEEKMTPAVKQTISDVGLKFMLGEVDEAAWNTTVENWRKNGGDETLKLMDDSYAKLPKK